MNMESYTNSVAWFSLKQMAFVDYFLVNSFWRQEISIEIAIFCRERGIRVVSEAWLADSIQKKEAQPFEAYDVVSDLSVDGKGIPWDKQDPSDEALESLSAEVWTCFIYPQQK